MRELTVWEARLRSVLALRLAGRSQRILAEDLGMGQSTVTKIISGERGFGACALEDLRRADPLLVASVFVPPGYALVKDDGGEVFLPLDETTVSKEGAGDGQSAHD